MTASDSPFPPACRKRFAPQRLLASGGFGEVWLATQTALGRPVALKVLHAAVLADEEQVQRFRDEARVTAALEHPGIVRILDHEVEAGVPWIAYEYLPGPSLRAYLEQRGRLPWREALEIGAQVAAALDDAHRHGATHRDIKPDNILQGDSGWKLADFGIAKFVASEVRTATGFILGTPNYISPEQIRGGVAGPAADLYALGVMLHELIEGEPPFCGGNAAQVLERNLKEEPRPLAGVPGGVAAAVIRALQKKPEDRHQSAAAMRTALLDLLDARTKTGEQDAPSPPARARPAVTTSASGRPTVRAAQARTKGGPVTSVLAPVTAPFIPVNFPPRRGAVALAAAVMASLAVLVFKTMSPAAPPAPISTPATPPSAVTPAEESPVPVIDLAAFLADIESNRRALEKGWTRPKPPADVPSEAFLGGGTGGLPDHRTFPQMKRDALRHLSKTPVGHRTSQLAGKLADALRSTRAPDVSLRDAGAVAWSLSNLIGQCVELSLEDDCRRVRETVARSWPGDHAAWIAPYLSGRLKRFEAEMGGSRKEHLAAADPPVLQALGALEKRFAGDPGLPDAELVLMDSLFSSALDRYDRPALARTTTRIVELLGQPGTGPCTHERAITSMRREIGGYVKQTLRLPEAPASGAPAR